MSKYDEFNLSSKDKKDLIYLIIDLENKNIKLNSDKKELENKNKKLDLEAQKYYDEIQNFGIALELACDDIYKLKNNDVNNKPYANYERYYNKAKEKLYGKGE